MPFTDYPNYLGVVVLAFALVALVGVRGRWVGYSPRSWRWSRRWFRSASSFPSSTARSSSGSRYFSKFRVPVMILIVQQLAVVVLFAAGSTPSWRAPAAGTPAGGRCAGSSSRGWCSWPRCSPRDSGPAGSWARPRRTCAPPRTPSSNGWSRASRENSWRAISCKCRLIGLVLAGAVFAFVSQPANERRQCSPAW